MSALPAASLDTTAITACRRGVEALILINA
jgi:hypothetical protein